MRIAFIVNNYPPRTGGVELHVRSLATELTRLGHKVLVITLGTDPGWSHTGDVEILTLPEHFRVADILGFPSIGTRRHLTRLIKVRKVDIVSVHTRFFPMSYVGMRAAHAARVPLIHTEHGSDHVASDSALIRVASRLVDFTLGRKVLRSADRVLGVSENVTDFTHRLAGVDGEIFYNAVDTTPGEDAETAPGSGYTSRPARLVFVGRLVAGKGWHEFLEAVASLRAEHPELTAEVLGDGTDMSALRALAASLDIEDIVSVRGRVPQGEVRQVLRGATLVNPTTLSEGFQTTLLEAIAEGGRVVTYPVPGATTLREQGAPVTITEHKDAGSLVSAVAAVIQDPGTPAPQELINRWTWPARAGQFVEICTAVQARV